MTTDLMRKRILIRRLPPDALAPDPDKARLQSGWRGRAGAGDSVRYPRSLRPHRRPRLTSRPALLRAPAIG